MKFTVFVDGGGHPALLGVQGDDRRCEDVTHTLYDPAGAAVWVGLVGNATPQALAASQLAFDQATAGLTVSRNVPCILLEN